ncbi:unnamed protein product [Closterium sp. NIES-53]
MLDGQGWRCVSVPGLGLSCLCLRYVCGQALRPCYSLRLPWLCLDAPGWQFYNPTSRRVLPSQDVTFDESVPFYHLFPYRSAPLPPPLLFLAPGSPQVDPLPPQGPAPSGVSQVDPPPGAVPGEVAVDSGAARGTTSGGAEPAGAEPRGAETGGAEPGGAETGGAELGGAETGGAEPGGAEPGGAETGGAEPGGAVSEGADSGGAERQGAASSGDFAGASPSLSPQHLREWLVRRARLRSGAAGAGGIEVPAGTDVTGGTAATGPGGARTQGTGAARTGGVGGAGAGDPTESRAAGAGGSGAGGARAGGVGGTCAGCIGVGGTGAGGARAGGADLVAPGGTVLLQPYFVPLLQQPASPLPAPSPYTEQSGSLTERREPASRPVSPVCTDPCAPRPCPPPVLGTHAMALRPSSVPLRVPLPPPPESSLPAVPDPESDLALAASPTVSRLLATTITDPSFETAAASTLVAELHDFAATCRLDYASALVAESESTSPPSVRGECALSTDVLEDRQEEFECLAAAGVDYFQTFSPNLKMTTLRVLLHVAAQRDYELHSLDFNTAFLQGSLHEDIWLRRSPGFTGTFAALGFAPSTADPSLFLRTDTSLLPFYVFVYVDDLVFATENTKALTLVKSKLQKRHTCTDLGELRSYLGLQITRDRARRTITLTQSHMVHQSVEPSGPYPELVGCLMYLMTCTRPDLAYPLSLLARYVAPVRRAWGSCLEDGVQLSSLVTQTRLGSSCDAEIYAGAMAAQELRWLTYLLTALGEQPRSPPVLDVDNKAMIALCQEHRTKHIALRYFLARVLQQRGQLRLAYVATRANTADIFTKALPLGDHQRFSTVLGLVPTLPHLLAA